MVCQGRLWRLLEGAVPSPVTMKEKPEHIEVRQVQVWQVWWGKQLLGAAGTKEAAEEIAAAAADITDHQPPIKKRGRVGMKTGAVSKAAQKRMAKAKKAKAK